MNLRIQAELDLSFTLEDQECGFGWEFTLENNSGDTQTLLGQQNDISLSVDPDTGLYVMSETASVVLRISSLEPALLEPKKGWWGRVSDINGNMGHYMIQQVMPDRTLGVIVCMLQKARDN